MITRYPTLADYMFIAHLMAQDEQDLYREMTGLNYHADAVAVGLFQQDDRRWAFIDAQGALRALCGYVPIRPGVWQSWFMAPESSWQEVGRPLTKAARGIVQSMLADEYVHRLETVTLATRTRARAWYAHIGLHYESTAVKASAAGRDLVMYVAVKGT